MIAIKWFVKNDCNQMACFKFQPHVVVKDKEEMAQKQ